MTKMIKMSLVAAVAVTGITTVNAQPLEEAIKGVDVSGMVRYRFESLDSATAKTNTNAYRLDVKTSSKVNDAVKANVTIGINGNTGADVPLGTEAADGAAALSLRDANFAINVAGATVIAGKQSIPGPFVDNSADDTARGNGVVALMPVGGLTLAAGTFNNTSLAGGVDVSEVAVIGSIGGVAADLWYLNAATPTEKTGFSAHANTTVAAINVDARFTQIDHSIAASDEASLMKVIASTKLGDVSVAAGYINTGKNNSATNYVSFDNDAATDAKVFQASAGNLADADAYLISAGTSVAGVSLKATYLDVTFGTADTGASELLFDAGYAMSKNFGLAAKYSTYAVDGSADSIKTRIEAKYTF